MPDAYADLPPPPSPPLYLRKVLFKDTDMTKQGEKLMKTLGIAVGMLDSMDKLVPILQVCFVFYGVDVCGKTTVLAATSNISTTKN